MSHFEDSVRAVRPSVPDDGSTAATVPKIYCIAAIASNGVIGNLGQLPWNLPEDLRHFRSVTMGHPVIMGRKTWESIGRPLPGRDNIVVTRTLGYDAPGACVAGSLEAALALCVGESVAFVIGGAELYRQALPMADGLVLTEIGKPYAGDTRFPAYDKSLWRETQRERHRTGDDIPFDFVLYERAAGREHSGNGGPGRSAAPPGSLQAASFGATRKRELPATENR